MGTLNLSSETPEYEWISYRDFEQRVINFSSGLISLGLKHGDRVGIQARNCAEWLVTEYSCYRMGLVLVPLYDTLGKEAVLHIVDQTEIAVIICEQSKIDFYCAERDNLETLTDFVIVDNAEVPEETLKLCKEKNLKVTTFKQVECAGQDSFKDPMVPQPEDLATICYTSGTSGLPKGVMLTHASMLCCGSGLIHMSQMEEILYFGSKTRHLSYLPLAHILERVVCMVLSMNGARIGFYRGDLLKLTDDAKILKPTVLVAVPRLLNKIYDKITANLDAAPSYKKLLFKTAFDWKHSNMKKHRVFTHFLFDRIVFKPIKDILGGCLTDLVSGSAPLNPKVGEFVQICFGAPITQAYGQTETCGSGTMQFRRNYGDTNVGFPHVTVEVKLISVPEMNYTVDDDPCPRGEVCIRGPACFKGYYKMPEVTKETIDEDGWIHTGDIGSLDEYGSLTIIDRKKNIFKLAQGEYVVPEKIERLLATLPIVSQIYVHGASTESYLVAIMEPDIDNLRSVASKLGISYSCDEDLYNHPAIKQHVISEFKKFGSSGTGELHGFEIPQSVHIRAAAFTVESETLTATMKVRRHQVRQSYLEVIDKMYKESTD